MRSIFLSLLFFSLKVFSQTSEIENEGYKTLYVIVITKDGKVNHIVKEGALISTKVGGKTVNGRWYFKAFPDVVAVVGKDKEILTQIELNKEEPLRIVTPQPKSGPSIGIGVGPVSVSNFGPGYQNFNMTKYRAEIVERLETKEEKLRREYYEKQEEERLAKEAAKAAKKAARKSK
ncbi:MAG: hypothetical protein H6587_11130 [Flavobacteriales bacterium]|nr:hypothetical protein [Flavobacteriales bacterium]MCB9365112.1 hypothetical protein [Flavobacteriales bacterium]